jgi:twinkle protein
MSGYLAQQVSPITPEILAVLETRGLDAEAFVSLDLGIGESKSSAGALAVPFYDGDEIESLQVLDPRSGVTLKHLSPSGLPYNINAARDPALADQPLIVVDDVAGCWAALIAGFPRSIAIPTTPAASLLHHLMKFGLAWQDEREIVVCTFADDAGNALREGLAAIFGRARCKWVRYPEGCRCLGDVLRQFKAKGIQETIQRASWLALPDIYSMSELPEPPENQALDTGIVGLKEHYRVRRGDPAVVSGVPGAGKTTFVNEVACRMAERHAWRTVFASFEQRPKPDHRRALRTFHAQKLEMHMSAEERAKADAWIEERFGFLMANDDTETSLDWLLERMAAAVHRFDAGLCVIDPWNELEHVRPPDMTQTEYTGMAIRAIKRFAKKHRVHVIVVAHPAKLMRDRNGKYPKPTLYDIADSAHWANKPDLGVLIWRDGPEPGLPTNIVVAKSRYYSEIGRPGAITGIWNGSTGRYEVTAGGANGDRSE